MSFWNHDEPLGLPKGSGRLILSTVIIIFCLLFFWVKDCFPTELVGIMGTVLGFYFGARVTTPDGNEEP